MNGSRRKVRRLLSDPEVATVVVEHRDRLGRMNTELVEAALAATGRRPVVLDDGEVKDDLVRDTVEVLTRFCSRLYGKRSARNRAERVLLCAAHDGGAPGDAMRCRSAPDRPLSMCTDRAGVRARTACGLGVE
jgi:putative resolvase